MSDANDNAPKKATTAGTPGTPEQQWRAVMLTALGTEARELTDASDAEIDDELRMQGINPERLAKDGNALARRLMREAGMLEGEPEPEEAPSAPVPIDLVSAPNLDADLAPARANDVEPPVATAQLADDVIQLPVREPARIRPPIPIRARWPLLLIAAAITTVAITTGVTIALRDPPAPTPDPLHEGPREPSPLEVASRLRHEAEKACATYDWQACADKLDQAKALDPRGEERNNVIAMRAAASTALAPRPVITADAATNGDKGPKGPGPGDKAPGGH